MKQELDSRTSHCAISAQPVPQILAKVRTEVVMKASQDEAQKTVLIAPIAELKEVKCGQNQERAAEERRSGGKNFVQVSGQPFWPQGLICD